MSQDNKFLSHIGVLGMKWGRRSGGSNSVASKRHQLIIDSSRKEGLRVAKKSEQEKKKGENVANALVIAKRKAKEGKIDQSFLDNKNISQKAKDNMAVFKAKHEARNKTFEKMSPQDKIDFYNIQVRSGARVSTKIIDKMGNKKMTLANVVKKENAKTAVANALIIAGTIAVTAYIMTS